ncbi:hypothetical protein AZE42_11110 [Rhizopogon vesiculosus]|uniref:Uncharacterized protein n=1 Tax=Rhizopogon vesiculosus TaxID=180088 RepID=A0A1J8QGJ7_9AGAM|nr:hypothetical protein AZE42_11110 [Rhizopogon vesiculosus]
MHLRDTDRDLNSSSSPYEQWGIPYKTARKNSNRLMRRLANWLGHCEGGALKYDELAASPVGSTGFYMRI